MAASKTGGPPDPGTPATPTQLAEKLRELRRWAGQPSLRRLRELGGTRPAADGSGEVDALPVSTLSFVLRGTRPASAEVVRSFVTACLRARQRGQEAAGQVERWHEAWLVATGHATVDRLPWQRQPVDGARVDPSSKAPAMATPPQQLPRDAARFTGRTAELEHLLALVPDPQQATAAVISVIDGMAGIGKTALAVHAAHRIADRFPDGQLFIDLHGYTPGQAPTQPAEALERLLRDLGIPGTQIPADLDARAALCRTRLAEQQMLIMLDNAATEDQVAPLLPGSAGCLVLVTSRRHLTGLDHTHTLPLDTLPVPDAVALFTQAVGEHRVADQPPELITELVDLCGRLPLAIQIAAARLRSHPTWSPEDLVQRLRHRHHRLDELETGQRSVAAALDQSYQQLSPDQQQAYRMLGAHPGVEFDAYATAALLDSTPTQAGRVLEQLLQAHLLGEPTSGRYRFHDLTRTHAAHTTTERTTPAEIAALGRLLDHYRHTAATAMDTAFPYEQQQRPQVPPAPIPGPDLPDPAAALAWLDTELPNLLAATTYAAEHGQPAHLLHLWTILHRHLRTRGHYADAATLNRQALDTARTAGDEACQLAPLNGLGDIHERQGRYEQAANHYQRLLDLAHENGDRNWQFKARHGLGRLSLATGHPDAAITHYQQALTLARELNQPADQACAHHGLAHAHQTLGQHQHARQHWQHALNLLTDFGIDHTDDEEATVASIRAHLERLDQSRAGRAGHLHDIHHGATSGVMAPTRPGPAEAP